jgi:hypothetical protein
MTAARSLDLETLVLKSGAHAPDHTFCVMEGEGAGAVTSKEAARCATCGHDESDHDVGEKNYYEDGWRVFVGHPPSCVDDCSCLGFVLEVPGVFEFVPVPRPTERGGGE